MDDGGVGAVRKAVELAKKGDRAMLRLVVERVVPKATRLAEEGEEAGGSLLERVRALHAAVAEGRMSLEEARERGKLLELERRAVETGEMLERLERIEADLRRRG